MRFVHTADWQIGRPFRQFGDRDAALRLARLAAIEKIGQLAQREGAAHVLVAGDVYDTESPQPKTLLEPLERMRRFPGVTWHLIPGNHDPHRPKGVWDRVRDAGVPENVRLHLTPEPAPLGDYALRIGLAHGSVQGFGTEGEASNPIAPARPERAGLAYLALGDWHRTVRIGPHLWYAGTPEPDRAGSQEEGQALLVDIAGPAAPPTVTPHVVGTHQWVDRRVQLADTADLPDMEARLRALPEPSCAIMRLRLDGTLPVAGRAALDRCLLGLAAALFHLDVDDAGLLVRPTAADLEAIDFGGVLRLAAERLKAASDDAAQPADARRRAEDALVQLFVRASAG